MVGSQYFPLYVYESLEEATEKDTLQRGLAFGGVGSSNRRDGMTDEGLQSFITAYPGERIDKEDIFYYVYGLLHSPDYRERYADNLGKELPRIPCVPAAKDFWAFSRAGRALADLHLNFDSAIPYPAIIDGGERALRGGDYYVEKMRFGKIGKDKDRTTVVYNEKITIKGIPLEAYEYVVNGKPAIEWVMEREAVSTSDASGIVNDPNTYAVETMKNPRYPLELLLRVVTVSVETMKIVRALPSLHELSNRSSQIREAPLSRAAG